MTILEAAADEIRTLLSDELNAKSFAVVLFIARRAEEIACAEGRPDEIAIKTRALEALEGKAPLTHAAIRDDLFSGSPTLKAKHIQLEKDHAKVRDASDHLRHQRENLVDTVLSLSSGDGSVPLRQLSSGDGETAEETDDLEAQRDYIRSQTPGESKELRNSFDKLPKSYEGELLDENDAHKEDAGRF